MTPECLHLSDSRVVALAHRTGSMPPCVPPLPPSKPPNSPRHRLWLRPLSARGGRRGLAIRSSTTISRRLMIRGRCGSSCRVSSVGRRTRGGFATIRKSSERLGFPRRRRKRQACECRSSKPSGKSGLTGSQERPHPIARQPARRGSDHWGRESTLLGAPRVREQCAPPFSLNRRRAGRVIGCVHRKLVRVERK